MEPFLLKASDVGRLLGLGRSKVFAVLAAGELPTEPEVAHERHHA